MGVGACGTPVCRCSKSCGQRGAMSRGQQLPRPPCLGDAKGSRGYRGAGALGHRPSSADAAVEVRRGTPARSRRAFRKVVVGLAIAASARARCRVLMISSVSESRLLSTTVPCWDAMLSREGRRDQLAVALPEREGAVLPLLDAHPLAARRTRGLAVSGRAQRRARTRTAARPGPRMTLTSRRRTP